MKKRATAIIICILLFINHVSAAVLYEFGNLEDAKEWVREIGTEYSEDSDYFDSYNEQLDVFYNSDDMIYLDFVDGEVVFESVGELLESRGYTYSDGIWSDGEGFYYEDSWNYMSWSEAEEEAREAGISYCPECERVIYESGDHSEECPESPINREQSDLKAEASRENQDVLFYLKLGGAIICAWVFVCIVKRLVTRKK